MKCKLGSLHPLSYLGVRANRSKDAEIGHANFERVAFLTKEHPKHQIIDIHLSCLPNAKEDRSARGQPPWLYLYLKGCVALKLFIALAVHKRDVLMIQLPSYAPLPYPDAPLSQFILWDPGGICGLPATFDRSLETTTDKLLFCCCLRIPTLKRFQLQLERNKS